MTDKIIINTISKIHFTIISFFIFVFLFLSTLFILLQDGIAINKIELFNLKVEQLYIKWDEKLVITAKNILIDTAQKDNNETLELHKIQTLIKKIDFLLEFVERISCTDIEYNDIFMSFTYSTEDGGAFHAISKPFKLNSTFYYDTKSLHFLVHELHYRHAKIYGEINLTAKLLNAALFLEVNDGTILDINIKSDTNEINYDISAHKQISTIKEILSLVDFPKEVRYWVDDAITLRSFELLKLYGTISYDNPSDFYKQIYAKAIAHELQYKYNPELESIDTVATHLEFKDGILYIRPHQATSYGFDLKASWLKIDFTKPQEILSLFLLFDGSLSKDVLTILNTYHIPVPFLQKKGITQTDLKLDVNLHTIDIEALGKFTTEDANFDFFDLNFDVAKADIILHNYDLTIEAKDANHQNMLIADIQTTLDMKNIRGDINLFFNTITDPSNSITLTKKQPLHAIYTLSEGHDSLWLSPSSWQFMGNDFHIEQTDLEIIFENISTKFEKVKVLFPNKAYLEISGEGSLKEKSLQSTIHIFNPSFFGITSAQKYIPIRLSYNNDTLTLATQRDTLFNYDNQKIWLKKTKLLFKDNILSLPKTLIKFDRFLEVNLQGNYNVSKDMGEIQTQDLVLKDSDKNPLLKVDRPLKISLIKNNNNFIATQKDLQLFTNFTNQGWSLEAKKLENIFSLSPFLYDYNLTNGFFSVTQQYTKSQIDFSLQTNYPYKFLHDTNKHIENYNIVGSYQTKNQITKIDINEKLSLIYDKKINLHAKDIGIDIFTLFNFIEEKMPKKETNTPIDIFFSAENSYLYLNKERRIIADTMELEFSKDGIDASLRHQNGEAHLNYDEKKQFILYGQGFSDTFLEQLFSYSKFQNANLGFTLNGTIDDFKGVLYLKDSTIKDYKIINNILAFVNTIPSLVTFSLPGYNNKGLFVTKGYVKFHAKDFLFDISDILLESKEISILGKGKIDYKKDSVDLELNLKTDLGSSVSKIPIIGYIFLDKQNIGTTLKVEGTLQDPSVSSLLAREIIVAPFSIIKRTFLLPYHLFTDDEE